MIKINENCIKAVKKYLEETLEIEADKKDVRELVEDALRKWESVFKLDFDIIIYKYLNRVNPSVWFAEYKKVKSKIRKENPLAKIKAIIAYYHEDYDTLADKITDLLS